MVAMLRCVAEFKRELVQERLVADSRMPKSSGKRIGRPRAVLNRLRIEQLRGEGLSWREVARRMELPSSTVYRYRGLFQNPGVPAAS